MNVCAAPKNMVFSRFGQFWPFWCQIRCGFCFLQFLASTWVCFLEVATFPLLSIRLSFHKVEHQIGLNQGTYAHPHPIFLGVPPQSITKQRCEVPSTSYLYIASIPFVTGNPTLSYQGVPRTKILNTRKRNAS